LLGRWGIIWIYELQDRPRERWMSFSGLYLTRVWMGSNFSTKLLPSKIRPLAAHVKLTENCQAKCISCDYWKTRWHDGIKADRAVQLLNEIGAAGIRSLRFTGGEPLLRTDLFEIMRRADMRPFHEVILQTNGLLIKKMHKEINASPITKVCISIDGLEETNDLIRGIDGYFDLAMQGIKLLRGKKVSIAVTLNRISAKELGKLAEVAHGVGAEVQYNVLSQSIYFIKDADLDSMWPEGGDVKEIAKFLRQDLKRPEYEVEYVTKYFKRQLVAEPPCILGYLQMFVLSNGAVMTGCYPLKPVGNILKDSLATILNSEDYVQQCEAMVRRECPGCTCGVESSLAMQNAASSAFFELGRLTHKQMPVNMGMPAEVASAENA
jgi:MoaA/NifB/PqqE/SkfB family radical SAM enzyme